MNKSINQFLVEQSGGCWHDVGDYADMNPDIDVDIDKYQCKKCRVISKDKDAFNNPDFSEWQNFGMLLKIAEKKGLSVTVSCCYELGNEVGIARGINAIVFKRFADGKQDKIPKITAELIAKAMGWKEQERNYGHNQHLQM